MQTKFTKKIKFIPTTPITKPVLFLTFNRPDTTQQVFSEIRQAQPPSLYVAGDGPRPEQSNEAEICEIVRSIATNVDWDCEVKTLFRDHNLGCRLAVSRAITWFFENEPEGIILEDDCLPSQSFFQFCQELLEEFRYDKQVGAICGFYSNELDYKPSASYFFSRYLRVWGWAGWRRSLEGYDSNLKNQMEKNNTWKSNVFNRTDVLPIKYFQKAFEAVANGEIDTWDTQLQYLLWQKKQRVIVSSSNMIKNIGWSQGAHTHDKDRNHELRTSEIQFPLTSPETEDRDLKADRIIERKSYRITILSFLKSQIRKLVQ